LGVILSVNILAPKLVTLKMKKAVGQPQAMNRHYSFLVLCYHATAHRLLRTAYSAAAGVIGMWGITGLTWKFSTLVTARILVEGEQPKFWRANFAAS
jgi:hypothetical protein